MEDEPGPFNQCEHEMIECHPGCGHWMCAKCGLSFDDAAEGGVLEHEPSYEEFSDKDT